MAISLSTATTTAIPAASLLAPPFPGRRPWLALVISGIVITAWIGLSERLSVDGQSLLTTLALLAWLFVTARLFAWLPAVRGTLISMARCAPFCAWLSRLLEGIAFIVAGFQVLSLLNHLTMSLGAPMADATLTGWDQALGLDWHGYAEWVAARPTLIPILSWAYSASAQAFGTFLILMVLRLTERARELLALTLWTGLACIAIAAWFPAMGTVATLGDAHLQTVFKNGMYFVEPLAAIRSSAPHVLNLDHMVGLASFPSFHTAIGLIIVWVCRERWWLLAPTMTYATIMIASTPLMGGHYFVDLIAGATLTIAMTLVYERSKGGAAQR